MANPASRMTVFSPDYLEHLAQREPEGTAYAQAELAGPWVVQEQERGFAVQREAAPEHREPDAVFFDREIALLVAAILPALGRDRRFQIEASETGTGLDVVIPAAGRFEKVGWLPGDRPDLVEALNVVEWLMRSPRSLSFVIEAANYPVLLHAEEYLERSLATL